MPEEIKKFKRIQRYKSIEGLVAALLGLPVKKVTEYELCYKNGEGVGSLSFAEYKKSIQHMGIWGFVDQKQVLRYWMRDDVPKDMVLRFMSHELGHINGRKYKNDDKEEQKATEFEEVTMLALKYARKIRGDF